MSKYPFIQQHDEKDCGAACLSMISEYYGLKLPIAKFRELIKVDISSFIESLPLGYNTMLEENGIKEMLEQFSETMTCIIIAHRMNTIKNCDYIYVMDKGSVIEQGIHNCGCCTSGYAYTCYRK